MQDFLRERWLPIVLAVIAVVFIAQNRVDTRISLFWLEVTWPLWLTLTVVVLVGVAIGAFLSRRHKRSVKS